MDPKTCCTPVSKLLPKRGKSSSIAGKAPTRGTTKELQDSDNQKETLEESGEPGTREPLESEDTLPLKKYLILIIIIVVVFMFTTSNKFTGIVRNVFGNEFFGPDISTLNVKGRIVQGAIICLAYFAGKYATDYFGI